MRALKTSVAEVRGTLPTIWDRCLWARRAEVSAILPLLRVEGLGFPGRLLSQPKIMFMIVANK